MLSDLFKNSSAFFSIATTCGGDAIRELLETPGISSHLLEVQIPYAIPAMQEYLQCNVEQACSEQTARLLASRSYIRTKQLLAKLAVDIESNHIKTFGLGVTASLASLRAKRGDHRVEAAVVSDDSVHTFRLVFNKNTRTRAEEDKLAAEMIRLSIAVGMSVISNSNIPYTNTSYTDISCADVSCVTQDVGDITDIGGVSDTNVWTARNRSESVRASFSLFSQWFPLLGTLRSPEYLIHHTCHVTSHWVSLWQKKILFLAGHVVDGRWNDDFIPLENSIDTHDFHSLIGTLPRLILPGSYHPLHQGHQEMRRYAENMFKMPCWYECSIGNVDKPSLDYMEVYHRLKNFPSGSRILLTQLPTFEEKSNVFPEAIFVIGADTLIRLADSKYYAYNEKLRLEALQRIADRGCRFLVFGRATNVPWTKLKQTGSNGVAHDSQEVKKFIAPQDIVIPPSLEKMCIFVSESEFREDVSSTEIRRSHF